MLVLVAHSQIFFASGEQQQQMQQQQSHSPWPITQLTEAAQARARGGQQRQDLGTTWFQRNNQASRAYKQQIGAG